MLLNWVSRLGVGFNALIIWSISYGPIHIYSGVIKDGFSSRTDGNSKKRAIGAGISGKGSYFSVHGGVVLKLGGSSNVCTFSTYPSKSKSSTLKGSKRLCARS